MAAIIHPKGSYYHKTEEQLHENITNEEVEAHNVADLQWQEAYMEYGPWGGQVVSRAISLLILPQGPL